MITSDQELEEKAKHLGIKINAIANKDRLPPHTSQGAYIINLQDSTDSTGFPNPGTHWTGLWIEASHAYYFDPFGLSPPANVQWFIQRYNPVYSSQQVQNERSGWCGYYTLMFLWYMSRFKHISPHARLEKFLHVWSLNPEKNLKRLQQLIRKR
jgi:hypothetical protein